MAFDWRARESRHTQYASVKMAASAVDRHAPVHLGTREHGVRLLVPPAVKLVISLITATAVSTTSNYMKYLHMYATS